jgi:hypothetical protein
MLCADRQDDHSFSHAHAVVQELKSSGNGKKITVSNQHRFGSWTELFLASCRKSTTMLHDGFLSELTLLSVSHMLCAQIFMKSKFSRCMHL